MERSFLKGVLKDVLNLKANFSPSIWSKLESLQDNLKLLEAFIDDVVEDERVRYCISEMIEVTYDAEDVIEMFLVNTENERSSRGFFKSIRKHKGTDEEEIDSIHARIHAICEMTKGMMDSSLVRKMDWSIRSEPRRWWKKDEQVVGMEDEVKGVLRESILDEEKKGVSIAVVEGMGGIGKTTLARQIYNHPDVVARFECRAWIMVSSEFTLKRTMKQLILQLPASDRQKIWELESEESTKGKPYVQQKFQEMLHKQLQGKTYFIVLDDVWEKEHWESLKSVFPDEQDKTSRLLVTTRNRDIVTHGPYTHHVKEFLDPKKSWGLLLMKALIDESNGGCSEELEPIGREIANRCSGLPLSIRVAGGLLAGTRTKGGWEQVLNQISSHLERAENSIFAISELSYLYLSLQLKSCFMCLAFFKEDDIIPAKTLLRIWSGLGLIPRRHERRTDERDYLDQLISRNMLQIVDLTKEGRVRNCYVHGILREVCLRRVNKELRLEIIKGEEGISSELSHKLRHLVVYGGNLKTLPLNGRKYLRSLFLLNDEGEGVDVGVSGLFHDFGKSCQLLKILYLDGIELSRFPDSLRLLIRLRCLMIRRHKKHSKYALDVEDYLEAVKLPNWLDDLKHLEIVDMEGEKVEFPNDVALKMKRLRYFSAYFIRGPISINTWENIETLKYMRQEDWIKCYSTLSSSCNVGELGLFLDPLNRADDLEEVRASLESLKKLEHLQLRWNRFIPFDPQIIPKLHTLTKLKLRGKLSKCPDATIFPPNLFCLTLALSDLREDLIPELSKLSKLSYLKLMGNAYKAERIQVLHDGFPCLKALSLREMLRLKSIDIQQGGMPHLEQLRIQQCPSLQTMNLPEHVIIKRIS